MPYYFTKIENYGIWIITDIYQIFYYKLYKNLILFSKSHDILITCSD